MCGNLYILRGNTINLLSSFFFIACVNKKRLGVSDDAIISDSQMFATTEVNQNHAARRGRLEDHGTWLRMNHDADGWLGVDFLYFVKISSILTQGTGHNSQQWATFYKISSSADGINYEFYKESGAVCIHNIFQQFSIRYHRKSII